MSEYDYFEDGFEEMIKDQKKGSTGVKDRFPVSYFGAEGTYIFRLYPENYKGKPRMRRTVWSNQLHNYRRVLTKKGDTRIDDLVKSAQEQGFDGKTTGFWKHKKNQDAIMMGYLISAPENKSIQKPGSATAIIMNWLQIESLDSFFDSLEEEGVSLRKFLHPGKPSRAIKMTIKKVQKGKKMETIVNCSSTQDDTYELPPLKEALPEGMEFPGLDEIHVKSDQYLTDELFEEFKKYYDEKINKIKEFKGNSHDPQDGSKDQGYQVEFEEDKKAVK